MTDMTQSTGLQAFIRQKDGYKVTVKISLWNHGEILRIWAVERKTSFLEN